MCSISGGTDGVTAFVGTAPVLPVNAGEMSCAFLGAAIEAWDEGGEPVVGHEGEFGYHSSDAVYAREFSGATRTEPGWQRLTMTRTPGFGPTATSSICSPTAPAPSPGVATWANRQRQTRDSRQHAVLDEVPELTDTLVVYLKAADELVLFVATADGREAGERLRVRMSGAVASEPLTAPRAGSHRDPFDDSSHPDGQEAGGSREAHTGGGRPRRRLEPWVFAGPGGPRRPSPKRARQ